ncbi:MAG: 2-phosphosulfolactate phosphatase [Melioribacteraceae bacterium]|jgi:2-phosphosulfolactate phosphatase|nr:2-phosphosulfolactate phosphatase [Ignavibacteriota bacterium]MBZ0181688.1 2-phosphosulfolactate phosphatase [Melioribacteraceae bacterium]|tara:strand:- start:99 stop:854 length:756 start_codon:yes stop_codon:yes gene_type:complete
MKVNVLLSPLNADDLYFTGKTTVVIDILRATSVIVTALGNGAREIIPVNTVDFAMKVSGNAFGGQTLLGGERNTKKIEGFALGNSPIEYNTETVKGKSIILYTTNGSKAIVRAKFSENLFICSFGNLNAIAEHLVKLNKDVVIVCSGTNGMFNLEDTICAGKLITEMLKMNEEIELTDASNASVTLNKSFGKSLNKMLSQTEHGKLLIENGFSEDIKICAKLNTHDIIPYYDSGVIKLQKTESEKSVESES